MAFPEPIKEAPPLHPPRPERSTAKWFLSTAVILAGVAAIIVGVAFIYWPAACIVGGLAAVGYAAFLMDVDKKPEEPE